MLLRLLFNSLFDQFSFTTDWDESLLVDHSKFRDQPGGIRTLKVSLSDRLKSMIYGFTAGETDIGFKKVLFKDGSDPSTPTIGGAMYAKQLSSKSTPYWIDEDGNISVMLDTVLAKAGDWMISSVTTARTGWTNVSATYSNKFMRINATPLTTGGADTHTHAAGSYAGPSHTHTVSRGIHAQGDTTVTGYLQTSRVGVDTNGIDADITSGASGTGAVTGTSASGDNVPAYVQTVVFQKD